MGFVNLLKCLVQPIIRIKHLRRILKMKQIKVTVGILTIMSCFVTLLLYYRYKTPTLLIKHRQSKTHFTMRPHISITNIPMKHMPLNELYPDHSEEDESHEVNDMNRGDFVDTHGCKIPVALIQYKKYKNRHKNCGKRAVFLKKSKNDFVQVLIKPRAMKKYLRKSANFSCCYRFIKSSSELGHQTTKIEYTTCKKIGDGEKFELETEFVNVKCYEYNHRNVTHIIYSDVYVFIKKIQTPSYQTSKKYNVMMIGMDSMSLSRTVHQMRQTVNYFKDNFWLGFRGYQKIADNTFPNLMAVFTGKNISTISHKCSQRMDYCNELLIWSQFKESGYITAYGEDYLRLPDTFSKEYEFRSPPTDHYLRPFYLHGEDELYNKSLVCSGKVPSGQHLLDYAFDFALTYRYASFFGLFWMNSFSHNVNSYPEEADKMFENLFNRLSYTGILDNTFIIFFSDHGIRFGEYRTQPAAYYEERSPALFMWVPLRFQGEQPLLFRAAAINQFRLITPYDLYNTLIHINGISSNITREPSDACPKCHSIFNVVSGNRTCADVEIHTKWCSCHKLYPLDPSDTEGMKSVVYAASQIKTMVKKVKTDKCWGCLKLALNNVIRIHFYYNELGLYYVTAFSMAPGNVTYEAVVSKNGSNLELVGDVSVISAYRGLGKCATHQRDRLFCLCQKKQNC